MENKNKLKIICLFLILVFLIIFFPKIMQYYQNAESIIKNPGNFGFIIYMFLVIIAILIVPIPSAPLAIIAGISFGPLRGMIYTLIGATIGAIIAFLVTRFFLRDSIKTKLEKNKFYKKLEGKNNKKIALIILVARFIPFISFDLVSYLAGLTELNIFIFALVTFIGMIPAVLILSFSGFLMSKYLSIFLIVLSLAFIGYIFYKTLKSKK